MSRLRQMPAVLLLLSNWTASKQAIERRVHLPMWAVRSTRNIVLPWPRGLTALDCYSATRKLWPHGADLKGKFINL